MDWEGWVDQVENEVSENQSDTLIMDSRGKNRSETLDIYSENKIILDCSYNWKVLLNNTH